MTNERSRQVLAIVALEDARGGPALRRAFITAALDAGLTPRDVREAAWHPDPRATTRCDRVRYR